MSKYIQFFHMSTGYVPGSIPPKFSGEFKRPIEVLGSDGIHPVDGRLSEHSVHVIATELAGKRRAIGYKLCSGLTCNGWAQESRLFLVNK